MIQPASPSRTRESGPGAILSRVVFLSVATLALVACAIPGVALAQSGQGNLEVAKELIGEGTRELIGEELEMSRRQADAFWAVYERFDTEMDLLGGQYVRQLENYMDMSLRGILTDSDADRIINEYLAVQIGMLRVRQKYLPEFREVLGGKKTARLYQLQNKVKAQVDAALADVVPLVETIE